MNLLRKQHHTIVARLEGAGLRPTRQRILLGSLLWAQGCRHVTAETLHAEAKQAAMKVSLATIYNTLHQFTDAGLLREIVVEAGKSCFDTNTIPHHHFLHEETGMVTDIPAEQISIAGLPALPPGTMLSAVDVVVRVRGA